MPRRSAPLITHTLAYPNKHTNNHPTQHKQKHKAFGRAFGKIYDELITPFKPIADALGPVVDTAVSFITAMTCPAADHACFELCVVFCTQVCPLEWICDVSL